MAENDEAICPVCGGRLVHYDAVNRVVRTAFGKRYLLRVERRRCASCGTVRRVTPPQLYSYKQYEAAIIDGFLSKKLSISMIEFEDYPTEQTIQNWVRSFGTG